MLWYFCDELLSAQILLHKKVTWRTKTYVEFHFISVILFYQSDVSAVLYYVFIITVVNALRGIELNMSAAEAVSYALLDLPVIQAKCCIRFTLLYCLNFGCLSATTRWIFQLWNVICRSLQYVMFLILIHKCRVTGSFFEWKVSDAWCSWLKIASLHGDGIASAGEPGEEWGWLTADVPLSNGA